MFQNEKPYVDKDGNMFVPKIISFPGQLSPKITPSEWFTLFYLSIDFSKCKDKKVKQKIKKYFCTSPVTFWRNKKSLKEKGYI